MDGQSPGLFPDDVIESIRSAPVVSIFFPYAMRSLILDMRRALDSDPRVTIDGIVASPQARVKSFRRLRPEMELPTEITVIPWIGHARQLEETGVLEAIYERCRWEGDEPLAASAAGCYRSILKAEAAVKRQIALGVGMHTLWRRPQE